MLMYLLSFFYLMYMPLFGVIVVTVVLLASTGTSLGIRQLFADVLIRIFEWGAQSGEESTDFIVEEAEPVKEQEPEQPAPGLRKRCSSGNLRIINREHSEKIESKLGGEEIADQKSTVSVLVDDTLDFITAGAEAIIEDQVTSRFKAEQLPSWNLLSRTKYSFQHISWKLTFLWIAGFYARYLFLVPVRVCLFFVGMTCMILTTSLVGYVPDPKIRKWLNRRAMLTSMRIIARSFSGIIRFHNRENMAKSGGICVANHTSPVDVMILSCDNVYAMIGQRQGGFLGFLQRSLSKSEHHIWFERSEASDRANVSRRLREHVEDPSKLPILIFPEGTCINNTSVMMFKKGSFEIGSTIYPIAVKYDSRLGDAFWNSSEQSYGEYVWMMMTSWAIICDVWYLPPMTREEGEDAISFARRVKRAIAKKGGLVDLEWDGALKREKVSQKLIAAQQKLYYERISKVAMRNEEQKKEAADNKENQDPVKNEPSSADDVIEGLSDEVQQQLIHDINETDDTSTVIKKMSIIAPELVDAASPSLVEEQAAA